jgi:hypothetical protein
MSLTETRGIQMRGLIACGHGEVVPCSPFTFSLPGKKEMSELYFGRMLKRQIFIVLISLLMAVLTYQLPYMTGQEIVTNEVWPSGDDIAQSNQEEIDKLLAKKSLTEEEFQLLKKYTSENSQGLAKSFDVKDIYGYSTYSKIRKSSILWLFLIWTVFFLH